MRPRITVRSGPSLRDIMQQRGQNGGGMGSGLGAGMGAGLGGLGGGAAAQAAGTDIQVSEEDFNAFERKLTDVEAAYSEGDLTKLRPLVTPEMLGYFAEDLAEA